MNLRTVLLILLLGMAPLLPAQDEKLGVFEQDRRFLVIGEVTIAGYGPASRALAESSCGGAGEANSHGRFAITTWRSTDPSGYCEVKISMQGCEGRVVPIMVPNRTVNLGPIILQPTRGKSSAGTVSFLALAAPPESAKLKIRAAKAMRAGNYRSAQGDLAKALDLYAKDTEAIYLAGMIHKELRQDAQALARFQQAAELDSFYAPPIIQLSVYALRAQDWPLVEKYASAVTALNPADYPEAWLYLATAKLMRGDYSSAELAARNAIDTAGEKGLPKAHHMLGLAQAKQNKLSEAVAQLRMYLEKAPDAPDSAAVKEQIGRLQAAQTK